MSSFIYKPFVLFKLNDPLFSRIIGGSAVIGRGSCGDVEEDTWKCNVDGTGDALAVAGIVAEDGQKCALFVDNQHDVYEISCKDLSRKYVGHFTEKIRNNLREGGELHVVVRISR